MKNKLRFLSLVFFVLVIAPIQQLHAQPPVINSFSPANGHVGGLVTVKRSKLNNPATVTIGTESAIIIFFEDTEIVAMVMPGAVIGAVSVSTLGGTVTAGNNFTVSFSAPSNKQLGNKIYGSNTENTTNASEQGFAVAISADGKTVVVGGDADNNSTGAVWIYTRRNNVWIQQGDKLTGTGAIGSNASQGYAVAVSADGNTFIEGGVGDNGFTGAAWIFTRDKNGIWTQQGNKLAGSNSIITNNTTPEQGFSVSISADGNTVIIGGRRDNNYIGAAWIFTRSNGVWTEQQKIIGTGYISTRNVQGTLVYLGVDMGTSVAISLTSAFC